MIVSKSLFYGLYGVVPNVKWPAKEIPAGYNGLWKIEATFRVTKYGLKVRPTFHWKPRRIAAHITICFTTYALVKHLEYRVILCYRKTTIKKIRKLLIQIQISIPFDKWKRIR